MYREVVCVCLVALILWDFPQVSTKPMKRSLDQPASNSLILDSIIPRSRRKRHAAQARSALDETLTALEAEDGPLAETSESLSRQRRTAMFMLAATLATCEKCRRISIKQRDLEYQVRLADS